MRYKTRLLAALLLAIPGAGQKLAFDVVSVKENLSDSLSGGISPVVDRLTATNMNLRALARFAYSPPTGGFLTSQIIGGPRWTDTARFDVEAIPADAATLRGQPLRDMLQSLLENRFQLKIHRETRDLPIYSLVRTKTGPKPSPNQTAPDPARMSVEVVAAGGPQSPVSRGVIRMVTGPSSTILIGNAVPVARLVTLLQTRSDRIVVDQTGYDKLIDVNIEFSSLTEVSPGTAPTLESQSQPIVPSLFAALQEAGLKLEPSKAAMVVVVIDSAEKPSKN